MLLIRKRLADSNQTKAYEEVEMPLIPILAECQHWGIGYDNERDEQCRREIETFKEYTKGVMMNVLKSANAARHKFKGKAVRSSDVGINFRAKFCSLDRVSS